jgi:hypothetical protein
MADLAEVMARAHDPEWWNCYDNGGYSLFGRQARRANLDAMIRVIAALDKAGLVIVPKEPTKAAAEIGRPSFNSRLPERTYFRALGQMRTILAVYGCDTTAQNCGRALDQAWKVITEDFASPSPGHHYQFNADGTTTEIREPKPRIRYENL